MTQTYGTSDVQRLFGITPQTARDYARDPRLEMYFSALAKPSKGGTRRFTEEDMRVISYIVEQRDQFGRSLDEIADSLAAGSRGEIPFAPTIQEKINTELEVIRRELNKITLERDNLRAENAALLTTLEYERGSKDALNRTIMELNREIGRLQAKLEMLSSLDDE